ncbi:asparaginase [Curvibacter sp. CHRR-16]|uniref:asparaginase n=1 Tax=Curvibacter sp. CHRR-16 TaxID=2835872 RepID=UPI001BDAB48F|nr:asparaginase [Curvibacter sp. CHRR-16]MBT0569240.1 asparaginase [Curvibacter sp. CHRR-16]
MSMQKKIVVIGTGGTIAGKAASAQDNVGYVAGQVRVEDLLAAVPMGAALIAPRQLVAEQLVQLDSKDMDFATWAALAQRCTALLADASVDGIVITHGTDTLEETAYFLHSVLPPALQSAKPVVLTCAMRPATALTPDGPQNLQDALAVVVDPASCGVLAVAAGKVHAALHVNKRFTYRIDAFDSGDAAPLAQVEEGRVRWLSGAAWCVAQSMAKAQLPALPAKAADWPRVEILTSYAGAYGALVTALLQAPADQPVVKGLVVAGTGNGTIHADLEAALRQAQDHGVRVVRTSRCAYGVVVQASAASDNLPAMPLSAVKARIALMLELLS